MLSIPRPATYVVAEIDIDATLREVVDPKIRKVIQAVKPAKCLMFLDMVRPSREPF